MSSVETLEKKRDGLELSDGEIRDLVLGYAGGSVPDYQMSAFLMAVVWRGMTDAEIFALTDAMVASGGVLDLSSIPGVKVDKHSTGGVGDKVSLAVAPLLAAGGVPVAKMSGRGLAHTGGTLDKLESVPGLRVQLTAEEIIAQVKAVGACICAQTEDLVPADRKMYALRDVTATVPSLPLIASSIMSKKLASGADAIVLDVKVGRGAFMKTLEDAQALALLMKRIGEARGKKVVAALTAMDSPLGFAVGNWLEMREVADLLQGKQSDDQLMSEVVHLAGLGFQLAGKDGVSNALAALKSGSGWAKLKEILAAQGGDISVFERGQEAKFQKDAPAQESGYVSDIDAHAIGQASMYLGAGRQKKEDSIDPLAGIWLNKTVGDAVDAGEPLARLYSSREGLIAGARRIVQSAYTISYGRKKPTPLIYETIA
ncbi:MAG TPA: thymidine phosphorylase [Capsulimonadaceae bacterium]|nr:thymidine phosphorylase [Capsulimonadaceae bacterium]